MLGELETSGYLAKLTEAAAVKDVEEAKGVGPEGGANVVEEYDDIDDEDISSTEQVEVGGVGQGGGAAQLQQVHDEVVELRQQLKTALEKQKQAEMGVLKVRMY